MGGSKIYYGCLIGHVLKEASKSNLEITQAYLLPKNCGYQASPFKGIK
ncbi:MAG: hypothetical protein F6K48_08620 [Okeania sp. SIO3H1]|nr:hypothetical protein [Okeania sp. SIO3H1]